MITPDSSEKIRISYKQIREMAKDGKCRIHFIGIGGVSMYSLARLTLAYGARVSGSDRENSSRLDSLRLLGAEVTLGHKKDNVFGADLIVYSHAISDQNPELLEGRALNLPIVQRAEYLGAIMHNYSTKIGVCGSHGKSTTVAMLDAIFSYAGRDPTTLSGADLPILEPYRIGGRDLLIYEACEYRDSFLRFSPDLALALNLELDHTDYFPDLDALKKSFTKALCRAKTAVISGDDPNLSKIKSELSSQVVTFGFSSGCDYKYEINSFLKGGFSFSLRRFGSLVDEFSLNIPGVYNLTNAAAAITTAMERGVDISDIKLGIESFQGIPRRLEYLGNYGRRPVYYDYAHHPTEISAALSALRSITDRAITLVFCPHTYTRTKSLFSELALSLSEADYPIITDIYAAREEPIEGVTSQILAESIGGRAVYCPDDEILNMINSRTAGIIVLMGAGDLSKIKNQLIK